MTVEIQLTQGQVALIDEGDAELIMPHKWCAHWCADVSGFYAERALRLGVNKRTTLRMSRVIMGAPKGLEVDHINHCTLDNRRANLRIVTHKQNMENGGHALRTTCPHGHLYDDANTLVYYGRRFCRACKNLRAKLYIRLPKTPEQLEMRRAYDSRRYRERTLSVKLNPSINR